MTARAAPVVLLLVLGCGESALPPPSITGVTPTTMVASTPTPVTVTVNAELASQADFGEGTLTFDTGMRVSVGPFTLGSDTYPPDGRVEGTLRTLFPTGTYQVKVTLSDGRSAVSDAGFTVTDGSWPIGYAVDPIADQRSGVPFVVTVHALPPDAAFAGNVSLELSPSTATVTPTVSGAFDAGVLTQAVTIAGSGTFRLHVSDVPGHNGQSDPFLVRP